MHRDLKPANILITKDGSLKLADLGFAQKMFDYTYTKKLVEFGVPQKMFDESSSKLRYSPNVVSLWYRAPEILPGGRKYNWAVDMWSVGCIMAQLWSTTPIMGGENEQQQLTLIYKLCGSITTKVWTEVEFLDLFNKMELVRGGGRKVGIKFATFPITNNMIKNFSLYIRCIHHWEHFISDTLALDLIDKFLTLNSNKRPTR